MLKPQLFLIALIPAYSIFPVLKKWGYEFTFGHEQYKKDLHQSKAHGTATIFPRPKEKNI